ncbi:MAG: isochorismatase family cysteine hydrolase [Pseudomonadota bacterium]
MDTYTAPDWSRSALITIDTQRDTLDGQPFEIQGTSSVLPRMKVLLDAFLAAERPIVHIVRIYRPDGSNVDLCRRTLVEQGASLVLAGSPGHQLAPDILPNPDVQLDDALLLSSGIQQIGQNEVVIYKPRWGAFYQTPLHDHLTGLQISTLVFSGCNYPNCPRTSIYEASERDYRVVLADDATSGVYDRGRQEMQNIGVALLSTDLIVNEPG